MRIGVLGPLSVSVEGEPVRLTSGKQAAILTVLALESPAVVTAERLVDIVWDDPAESTSHSLQQHISALRKVLEPLRGAREAATVVVTRRLGYELHTTWIDIDEFRQRAAAGSDAAASRSWDNALAHLDAALGLWRGPALADIRGSHWFDTTAARLEDQRMLTAEVRIQALLGQGRSGEVVPQIEELLAAQPLRERLWSQLMVALYRSGRQADALAAYQRAHKALVEQLGLEPGPELRNLEDAILRQDPSLELHRQPGGNPSAELRSTLRTDGRAESGVVTLPDGQVVQLTEGENLIGRQPDAQVLLTDSRVSRMHAVIEVSDDRAVVRDLASTNGTTVNGEPVDEAQLDDGDVIGLGGVELPYER